MSLTYLSSVENLVTVNLAQFSVWNSCSEHLEYHRELLDGILLTHAQFSVEVDARTFSLWHLGAIPIFRQLADMCRTRYRGKLGIYNNIPDTVAAAHRRRTAPPVYWHAHVG